jgi:hypothetical protein
MPADESRSVTHMCAYSSFEPTVFGMLAHRGARLVQPGDQAPRRVLLCLPKRHRLFEELIQIVIFRRT